MADYRAAPEGFGDIKKMIIRKWPEKQLEKKTKAESWNKSMF